MPRTPIIKTRTSKFKASATHNKEKMSCLLAETCMNKYVQTLSHTSQQKIINTTGKKKGGMKGKKIHHLALAHIMHAPHKACNFRFTENKGRGEKSKPKKVKGREKNQSRD
jgi:hypothetical protein